MDMEEVSYISNKSLEYVYMYHLDTQQVSVHRGTDHHPIKNRTQQLHLAFSMPFSGQWAWKRG